MSFLDPRTVILVAGMMGGLLTVVMLFMRRNYPRTIRGLAEWTQALGLLFFAGVFASLHPQAPDLVTVVLPNLFISTGTCRAYIGSRRFFSLPPREGLNAGVLASANLVLLWFTLAEPSYRSRTLVLTLVLAAYFALHAHLMLGRSARALSHRAVGAVLALATTNELVRFVTALTLPVGDSVLDTHAQSILYITAYPFLMMLLAIGFVLLATDRLRSELEHLATHDSLTNTLTRRSMSEACERELERCRRHGHDLALMTLDMDHFKLINDTFGHQAGDQVLVRFVQHVQALLRRTDQLGRFGGEEFVVLLPRTSQSMAMQVAERIRAGWEGRSETPHCTVSIGVAVSVGGSCSQDQLLGRADAALYRAKALGRNRVEG